MCQGCSTVGGEERVGFGGCEFELGLLVLEYSCSQLQATVTGGVSTLISGRALGDSFNLYNNSEA